MTPLDHILALNPADAFDADGPSSWHLEPGYSLDHLRILTGPVCESCWECDGRVMVGDDDHEAGHAEAAYERQCESFYGGAGGMSDRERHEQAWACGRRL